MLVRVPVLVLLLVRIAAIAVLLRVVVALCWMRHAALVALRVAREAPKRAWFRAAMAGAERSEQEIAEPETKRPRSDGTASAVTANNYSSLLLGEFSRNVLSPGETHMGSRGRSSLWRVTVGEHLWMAANVFL